MQRQPWYNITYCFFSLKTIPYLRVAAKIFVLVFSRKFREIIHFAFRKIFLQFREIFAKHEIEICAKFVRNSKEISRTTKLEIITNSFFNDYLQLLNVKQILHQNSLPKSIEKCNFPEDLNLLTILYSKFKIIQYLQQNTVRIQRIFTVEYSV